MAAKRKQWGIQSVEVAAGLLRALIATGRPAPLKHVATLARLHPGKAHRYLVSLTRAGLVEQDAATGHYGIGALSIALGLAGLRNLDVVRVAQSRLPALRDRIDETVLLALWSGQGPVVFDLEDSARPVTMNVRVGSILPLLTTATGRVFAAFLPGSQTRRLIAAERTPKRAVAMLLARTRALGLAHVSGDLVPGVNALAAPVFDHKSRIAAVIGALGRSEDLDVGFDGAVARALKSAADEISRRLGFRAPEAR